MTTLKIKAHMMVLLMASVALIAGLVGLTTKISAQSGGDDIPTPTPQPVGDVLYNLTQVGGTEATFTMPAFEQNGIRVGETTMTSVYPQGMIFTTTTTSINGPITTVTLLIELASGLPHRTVATYDDDSQLWTAHMWVDSIQPAWSHFTAHWSITDSTGQGIETEATPFDYVDPTRQWWRVESEHVIVYWYDGLAGEPEAIAQGIVNGMAATHERRVVGFGGPLSYKPIGVIYANTADLSEIFGSAAGTPDWTRYDNPTFGMMVLILGYYDDDYFEQYADCLSLDLREEYTEERITTNTFSAVPANAVYLYQYDKKVESGPSWWREGQARWFSIAPGDYDLRLRNLARLQDLPTLNGDNIGGFAPQADGCYGLPGDVGASFINWLLASYGGLQTHADIIADLRSQMTLYEAIEEVTGKSFLEIENEWRAYIGFNLLDLADFDPASALQGPLDAAFAVGDVVTLPAMPLQVTLYEAPGPNQPSNVPCFGGADVTILRVGSLDGVNYYEVDCGGLIGWTTLGQLQGGS